MKRLLTLLLSLFIAAAASGQAPKVTFERQYNSDNSVSLVAKRRPPIAYTVKFEFSDFVNTMPRFEAIEVVDRDGEVMRFTPTDSKYRPSFAFRYWTVVGDVKAKPDTTFVYALPFSPLKGVRARYLSNLNEKYFKEDREGEKWHAYQFLLEKGDTVYAARKGVVYNITDGHDPIRDKNVDKSVWVSYSTSNNHLYVQHADGTSARYSVLQKGSFMVEEGETVCPGQPIALAGSYDAVKYEVRFDVHYMRLTGKGFAKENKFTYYDYVEPLFSTAQGVTTLAPNTVYGAVMNEALITKEMNNREKKVFKTKK